MTPFLAVCANISYDGYPPVGHGRPPMEAHFETQDLARAWLKARGGGAISTHNGKDWNVVERVPPG